MCTNTPSTVFIYEVLTCRHPMLTCSAFPEPGFQAAMLQRSRLDGDKLAAFQVKGRWRAQYARYRNKGIVVLAILMALTGVALILAGMQQPRAPVILPGGGTGPSRNEQRAGSLQEARKAAKQKSSLTSGCPMLRVPKV